LAAAAAVSVMSEAVWWFPTQAVAVAVLVVLALLAAGALAVLHRRTIRGLAELYHLPIRFLQT
jgi:hypothetical protein